MHIVFILLTIIVPPLGLPLGLIGLYSDRRQWKAFAFIIALAVASFAYNYDPLTASDIVRYFDFIEEIRKVSLLRAFGYGSYGSSGLYVFTIACWIAGKLGDPRIIPALSVFFVYYLSLYMTGKVAEDLQCKRRSLMVSLLFILTALNFYAITNNVRNVLALVLIGYATFRDCFEHKHNLLTYVLYVLPIFIHQSAILVLALRVLLSFSGFIKWVGLGIAVLVYPLLELIYPLSRSMKDGALSYLGSVIAKAHNYYIDDHSVWGLTVQASISESFFKAFYVTICIILGLCILLVLGRKAYSKSGGVLSPVPKGVNRVLSLSFYTDLIVIVCIPMLMPIYWRFCASMISYSGGGLLMCEKYSSRKDLFEIARLLNCVLGVCVMILWMRNLAIYSNVFNMFVGAFRSSPVIVLVRDMIHLF